MSLYQMASFNPSMPGTWRNTFPGRNYFLLRVRAEPAKFGRLRVVYVFEPNFREPLHFEQEDGTCIAAGGPFETDQGSVPPIASGWIPKDLTLGYFLHDFACLFGGLFFRYPGEERWAFRLVRRWDADGLLGVLAMCDPIVPVGRLRASIIVAACRMRGLISGAGDNEPPPWKDDDGLSAPPVHL